MSIKRKIKKNYYKFKYKGNKYTCPICEYKAAKFLDAGLYERRINSKCPNCGSLERHRGMWLVLQKKLSEAKDRKLRILHIAPEACLESVLKIDNKVEYLTSHYSEDNPSDFNFDLHNIDNKDEDFDIVICSHVLEHVDDDVQSMKEINRILVKGGVALIQVPFWPSEAHPTYENSAIVDPRDRIIHFGQFDHVRIYGLDFVDRLKSAGFNVETIDLEKSLSSQEVEKYALHNSTNIRELTFVCTK